LQGNSTAPKAKDKRPAMTKMHKKDILENHLENLEEITAK